LLLPEVEEVVGPFGGVTHAVTRSISMVIPTITIKHIVFFIIEVYRFLFYLCMFKNVPVSHEPDLAVQQKIGY